MNDCDLKACESIEAVRDRDFKRKVESSLTSSAREMESCTNRFKQLVGDRQIRGVYTTEDNDLYKEVKYKSGGVAGWDQLVAVATTDDRNYVWAWFKVHNMYLDSLSAILNHLFIDIDDVGRRARLVTCAPSITIGMNDVVLSWPTVHENEDPAEITQKLLAEKLTKHVPEDKSVASYIEDAFKGTPLTVTGYTLEGADDLAGARYEVSVEGQRLDPKDNLPDNPDYIYIRAMGRANLLGWLSQAIAVLGAAGISVGAVGVHFTKMSSQIILSVSKK